MVSSVVTALVCFVVCCDFGGMSGSLILGHDRSCTGNQDMKQPPPATCGIAAALVVRVLLLLYEAIKSVYPFCLPFLKFILSVLCFCCRTHGCSSREKSKLDEAEPLQRSALAIGERMLGTNHSDVATYYNNLSR